MFMSSEFSASNRERYVSLMKSRVHALVLYFRLSFFVFSLLSVNYLSFGPEPSCECGFFNKRQFKEVF